MHAHVPELQGLHAHTCIAVPGIVQVPGGLPPALFDVGLQFLSCGLVGALLGAPACPVQLPRILRVRQLLCLVLNEVIHLILQT